MGSIASYLNDEERIAYKSAVEDGKCPTCARAITENDLAISGYSVRINEQPLRMWAIHCINCKPKRLGRRFFKAWRKAEEER